VVSVPALMADAAVQARGLSITRRHDTGDEITTIGPAVRLSRTPVTPGRPVASPGADAAAILAALGRADDLAPLTASGALGAVST
jgi:crotonobetainyl-CoA:carnitine CoA-transferase CaiB-like acyl-CoA transferase